MGKKSIVKFWIFSILCIMTEGNQNCVAQVVTMNWNGKEVRVASGEAILSVATESEFAALASVFYYFGVVVVHHLPNNNLYLLEFDTTYSVTEFCDSLNSINSVRYCEPSFSGEPSTHDTYWNRQWYLRNTGEFDGYAGVFSVSAFGTKGSVLLRCSVGV